MPLCSDIFNQYVLLILSACSAASSTELHPLINSCKKRCHHVGICPIYFAFTVTATNPFCVCVCCPSTSYTLILHWPYRLPDRHPMPNELEKSLWKFFLNLVCCALLHFFTSNKTDFAFFFYFSYWNGDSIL